MNIEEFFDKLQQHYHGYQYGDGALTVKFYAQPSSFSFEIYVFEDREIHNYLNSDNIKFHSEVYYGWMDDDIREDIIKDINTQLEVFEKKLNENSN